MNILIITKDSDLNKAIRIALNIHAMQSIIINELDRVLEALRYEYVDIVIIREADFPDKFEIITAISQKTRVICITNAPVTMKGRLFLLKEPFDYTDLLNVIFACYKDV